MVSMTDSSKTDCALSVTGPYESTAIVTGPMPRKPNATRPNANTAAAALVANVLIGRPATRLVWNSSSEMPGCVDTAYAMPISAAIVRPIQYAEKLPAVRPDRMLSDGPPLSDAVTVSRTWPELTDVNTLTSSGITAPASVPHEMIASSFHHSP